jgi:hypothetical protein
MGRSMAHIAYCSPVWPSVCRRQCEPLVAGRGAGRWRLWGVERLHQRRHSRLGRGALLQSIHQCQGSPPPPQMHFIYFISERPSAFPNSRKPKTGNFSVGMELARVKSQWPCQWFFQPTGLPVRKKTTQIPSGPAIFLCYCTWPARSWMRVLLW